MNFRHPLHLRGQTLAETLIDLWLVNWLFKARRNRNVADRRVDRKTTYFAPSERNAERERARRLRQIANGQLRISQ